MMRSVLALSLCCIVLCCVFVEAIVYDKTIGTRLVRTGNEIMVCGQLYDIGTEVVLWTDVGGYDAYRTETRFTPWANSSYEMSLKSNPALDDPIRYGMRYLTLTPEQIEQVRGGGWPLSLLQETVDLFVYHYDVAGYSKQTFEVLQDERDLSVHFMLDLDGTIYQTLDLKEKAYHAGFANTRTIGIEIANVGAYQPPFDTAPFKDWYVVDGNKVSIKLPNNSWIKHPERVKSPARSEMISGAINGQTLYQYDFTPAQYEALSKLTAVICLLFPKIKCDYPKDANGHVLNRTLTTEEYTNYHGLLGHYHLTNLKIDPGPAFNWRYVKKVASKYLKIAKKNQQRQKKNN
eukprot:TRINITY_DN8765_c0_g1_i1.p1 TRINITY_DN8765_c0_g1~~TRINITY_DN8765_c0_g1_i1.p1  ORF type:complete len:347 (+),score=65.22 TRINITY_DN8765_c0_g1_i1:93-1133(+)